MQRIAILLSAVVCAVALVVLQPSAGSQGPPSAPITPGVAPKARPPEESLRRSPAAERPGLGDPFRGVNHYHDYSDTPAPAR